MCLFAVGPRRCHLPRLSRGLCRDHYAAAYYQVKTGKETWRHLASEGKALLLSSEDGDFFERVASANLIEEKSTSSSSQGGACLVPECEKRVVCRGLCSWCYQQARLLVFKGKVTWEGLVENKKALGARSRSTTTLASRFFL